MTQTMGIRTNARYRGVVYGIDVLDHVTGEMVPDDYVGKTRQRGRGRENQHRDRQPFSDRIVGSPRVLWEGVCTEAELDAMELHFIREGVERQVHGRVVKVRPRLNVEHNEDNPYRIPKYVQEAQRREREPGWVPFDQRPRISLLEWDETSARPAPVKRVQRKPKRLWKRWLRHLLGWVVTWAVLAVGGWVLLVVNDRGGWKQTGILSAVLAALLVAVLARWVWLGCPLTKRQWRRAKRRRR